jgi:hypothetical protein
VLAAEAEKGRYTHSGCAGSLLCCERCGVLVGNKVAHDIWHVRMDETARRADLGSGLPPGPCVGFPPGGTL